MTQALLVFSVIRTQLLLLGVLVVLEIAKSVGLIPPPSEILHSIGQLLADGGWWFLLIVSFAEHLVGVNVYFPGSIVIFVSVSSLAGKPWVAVLTVLATTIAAISAHQVNLLLGRRLRGRSLAPQVAFARRVPWGPLGMAAMFWHPHLGALAALAAGRDGVRYRTAIATIVASTAFWQALWGLFAYNAGRSLGRHDLGFWPMTVCVLIWAGIDLYRHSRKQGPQDPL